MNGKDRWSALDSIQKEAFDIAEQNGFHDARTERATALALIHSEVSEALEADRDPAKSKEDYGEELADILIRVFDHAEEEGVPLAKHTREKMAENRNRPKRHGKEY